MAAAIFSHSRSILSKYNFLVSTIVIPKCPNHTWVSIATLQLGKSTNGHPFYPNFNVKKNTSLNTSYVKYDNRFTNMSQPVRNTASIPDSSSKTEEPQLSNKDKLKRAVKEYGATVIIFHVTISLMSLGVAYLAVTSGVDMPSLLAKIGLATNNTETVSSGSSMLGTTGDVAAGVSTFVVAYAIHKVFAPVRISITLVSTPFIVRHLRKIGFLKPPKPSGA